MQGTWVQFLVQENPTCHRAAKPMCHNYWACTLEPTSHSCWAHVPQLLKPVHLEPMLHNQRSHLHTTMKSSPCLLQLEKACTEQQRPNAAKIYIYIYIYFFRSKNMVLFLDYVENNKNKDSTYQNVWCVAKTIIKYKVTDLKFSFWKRMNLSKCTNAATLLPLEKLKCQLQGNQDKGDNENTAYINEKWIFMTYHSAKEIFGFSILSMVYAYNHSHSLCIFTHIIIKK